MLNIESQTIQEANRKEINKNKTPFDTVYIKSDTVFYWKNNEYKGMSVLVKGNNVSTKDYFKEEISPEINSIEEKDKKIPFDSVYVKDNTMYYWRNNTFKGKTIIIRGKKKHEN